MARILFILLTELSLEMKLGLVFMILNQNKSRKNSKFKPFYPVISYIDCMKLNLKGEENLRKVSSYRLTVNHLPVMGSYEIRSKLNEALKEVRIDSFKRS